MVKIYTLFQSKKGLKSIPFGAAHTYAQTYTAYIGEYPPPPPSSPAWMSTYYVLKLANNS